ncbi:MAG: guanylate kinase [Ignavibacteria bacterium]|jgi:guanylate kinase
MSNRKHLIVLSAPSGAGKTTVARHLLQTFPQMKFSVSATTRAVRSGEEHGRDYFFLTKDDFRRKIEEGDLVEYEEIFGNYYGTLKSFVSDSISRGEFVVFDVDVKGALSLRAAFPDDTLLMFVAPPSLEVLEQRLRSRHTETDEQINTRLSRAEMEMAHQDMFDVVLVNSVLSETLEQAKNLIQAQMEGAPQQPSLFGE